jgi:hypothetical protein
MCGRSAEDLNKELGPSFKEKSVMFTPDIQAAFDEVQNWREIYGEARREPIPDDTLQRVFGNVRMCVVCSILSWCGTQRRFIKEE